jgi:hypothetical protein
MDMAIARRVRDYGVRNETTIYFLGSGIGSRPSSLVLHSITCFNTTLPAAI